jgi:hypothetical protein
VVLIGVHVGAYAPPSGGGIVVLLPNEKILMQSEKNILTLTTHRIRRETKGGGHSSVVSITLDAVASCELITTSVPVFLVVAVLAAIGGLVALPKEVGIGIGAFFAAIALVVVYFITRRAVLKISSAGDDIVQPTRGMSHEAMIEFIEAVERAKFERTGTS